MQTFPAAHDGRPRCGATELNHDDPSSFSPPAAFGPFRVLHQIGSGVLGPVFRTYEPERDRLIAVKGFRIDLLPEQAALLATELQRIVDSGLAHPAIVQPVAAGMEGHLPYLAQEYVAAESLDIAMKHYAPAAPSRVMPFLQQIAAAIDAAAAAGILHGGLHPRDIFLTTDEARATGFGIVQAIENIGFRAPTRRPYTAPERVNGDEWGIEADVFSLGAIAHELLTGRRPAGPGDQDGTFNADVPAEHRAQLRDVLARALAEDPAGRFESATAFVQALDLASEGRSDLRPRAAAAAAPAVAAAAAAPTLFDASDVEPSEPVEPVATIDDVETQDDVEDVEEIEDEDDIEDQDDIATESGDDPGWPPPGFATRDLDIAVEKDADEALGEFDLNLHPAETFEPEIQPTEADKAEALAAAEAFEYETGVEGDEAQPAAWRHDDGAAAAPGVAAAAPDRVDARRSSTAYAVPVPAPVPARAGVGGPLWLIGGLALGLFLGWFFFGPDAASEPAAAQAGQSAPAAAEPAPSTEVPVPQPSMPAGASPTPVTEAAPPPPSRGSVLVRSTPSNAMVVIDGEWSGRTPLTRRGLALGDHTVRVVLDGYEPINRRVTLTAANASREMTFDLRRRAGTAIAPRRETAPPAGTPAPAGNATLAISSRPAGGRATVDGRFVGVTPVTVAGLAPGVHNVRIELDGYRPWSGAVRVAAGQDARVAAPLVPQR